jgi:hypothetical protein
MNKARSFEDKFKYLTNKKISLEPNWLQGFIDGEGSFQIDIQKRTFKNKTYNLINPTLQIKQNNHDVALLSAIKEFFSAGYLKPKYNIFDLPTVLNLNRTISSYWLSQSNKIIQFIDKFPLYTTKRLDYFDWKEIVNLKKNKIHSSL